MSSARNGFRISVTSAIVLIAGNEGKGFRMPKYNDEVVRVWLFKGGFKTATQWRLIKKGYNKNKFEVVIRGKKHIVNNFCRMIDANNYER